MTTKKKLFISLLIIIPVLAAAALGVYFLIPKAPGITSIRLQPEISLEYVYVDEPFNINLTIEPKDADKKDVVWYSSDENIATVDADGKVTPVGAGFVTITAINKDNPLVKSAISFWVKSINRQLEMNPVSVVYDGNSHQTYVEGWNPENGTLVYKFTGTLASGELYTADNELSRTAPTEAGFYKVFVEIEGTSESNYSTLTIKPKPITVSVNSFQKEYLDPSPTFTYEVSGLIGADNVTFQILGGDNENVNNYTLALAPMISFSVDGTNYQTSSTDTSDKKFNYTVTSVSTGTLGIMPKPVKIKVLPKTSIYGEPLVPLVFEIYDSQNDLLTDAKFYSSVSGSLTMDEGATLLEVGTYGISSENLTSINLQITSIEDSSYSVTKRVISVYPNGNISKYAGVVNDPPLDYPRAYSLANNSVQDGAIFNNLLTRAVGETVGTYSYHLVGGVVVDGEEINTTAYKNYTLKLINTGHVFSIIQNTVQIGLENIYQNYDPLQSYTQNTLLDTTINYVLFINGVKMTADINSNGISLIGNDRFSIVSKLGDEDTVSTPPTDTYKIYNTVVTQKQANFQDNFTVVGDLDINKYDISFGSAKMFVQKLNLTLNTQDATKIYGDSDPQFDYSVTGFVDGDTKANSLTNIVYNRIDSGTKTNNTVGQYSINIISALLNKDYYKLTFVPGTLSITPLDIDLYTKDYARPYGATIPEFVYTFVDSDDDGVDDISLPYEDTNSDVATGSLIKSLSGTIDGSEFGTLVSGFNVGVYDILDTTLTKNINYNILLPTKTYTITKRQVTLMPLNLSVVYGDNVPQLLYTSQIDASFDYTLENPLLSLTGSMRLSATEVVYTAPTLPLMAGTYYFDKGTLALGDNFELEFDALSPRFIVSPLPTTLSFITKNFTGAVPGDDEAVLVFSSSHGNSLAYSDSVSSLSLTLTNIPESTLYYASSMSDVAIGIENIGGYDVTSCYAISLNATMNIVFEQVVANLDIGITATAIDEEDVTTKPYSGATPWTFSADIINPPVAGLYIDPSSISFKFLYPNGQSFETAPKNAGSYLVTLDLSALHIFESSGSEDPDIEVTHLYSPMLSSPVTVNITPINPIEVAQHTLTPLTYGVPYTYDEQGKHVFITEGSGREINGGFNIAGSYHTSANSNLSVGSYLITVIFVPGLTADVGGQFKNYNNVTLELNLTIQPFSITKTNELRFTYDWATSAHPTYSNSAYPNTITNLDEVLESHLNSFSTSYSYYGFSFGSNGLVSLKIKNGSETKSISLEELLRGELPTLSYEETNFTITYPYGQKITLGISGSLIATYFDGLQTWDILNIYSNTSAPRAAGFYISAATITATGGNVTLGGQSSKTFYSGFRIFKTKFNSFVPKKLEYEYMETLNFSDCTIAPSVSGTTVSSLGYSISPSGPFNDTLPTNAGDYYVKLEANQANFYSVEIFTFKIIKAHISATLMSPTAFAYDGNKHKPEYRVLWGEIYVTSLQIAELLEATIPDNVWINEDENLIVAINGYLTTPIAHIKQAIMLKEIITQQSLSPIVVTFSGTQNNGNYFEGAEAPTNAGTYFMQIVINCINIAGGNNDLANDSKKFYINPQSAPNIGITFTPVNVAKDSMSDFDSDAHIELFAHIANNMIGTNSTCITPADQIITNVKNMYSNRFTSIADRKFSITYLDDQNEEQTAEIYIDIGILGGVAILPRPAGDNVPAWYNAINGTIGAKTLVLTINFVGGNTRKIEMQSTISVNRIYISSAHFIAPKDSAADFYFINEDVWAPLIRDATSPLPVADYSPDGFNGDSATYQNSSTITIKYIYSQQGNEMTHAPRELGVYDVKAIITTPPSSYYIIGGGGSLVYEYTFTIISSTIYSDISDETVYAPFKNAAYNADYIASLFETTYQIKTATNGVLYSLTFGVNPSMQADGLTFNVFFDSPATTNVTAATTYKVYLQLVGNFSGNIVNIPEPYYITFDLVITPLSAGSTESIVLDHIQNSPPFEYTYSNQPDIAFNGASYNNAIDELSGSLYIAYFTDTTLESIIDIEGDNIYNNIDVSAGIIYFRIMSGDPSISPSVPVALRLNKASVPTSHISIDDDYMQNNVINGYYIGGLPVEVDKTKLSVTSLPEALADDFVVEYYIANSWQTTAPTGLGQYDIRISLNAKWYVTEAPKTGLTFIVSTSSIHTAPVEFEYSDFEFAQYEHEDAYLPITFYSPTNEASSELDITYEDTQLYGWWLFSAEDVEEFLANKPSSLSIESHADAIAYIETLSVSILTLAQINALNANAQPYDLPCVFICNDSDIGAIFVFVQLTVNKKYVDLSSHTATFDVDDVVLAGITKSGSSWSYAYENISLRENEDIDLDTIIDGVLGELVLGESVITFSPVFTISSANIYSTFSGGSTLFTPSSLIVYFESSNYIGPIKLNFNLAKPGIDMLFYDAEMTRPFTNSAITSTYQTNLLNKLFLAQNVNAEAKADILSGVSFSYESSSSSLSAIAANITPATYTYNAHFASTNYYKAANISIRYIIEPFVINPVLSSSIITDNNIPLTVTLNIVSALDADLGLDTLSTTLLSQLLDEATIANADTPQTTFLPQECFYDSGVWKFVFNLSSLSSGSYLLNIPTKAAIGNKVAFGTSLSSSIAMPMQFIIDNAMDVTKDIGSIFFGDSVNSESLVSKLATAYGYISGQLASAEWLNTYYEDNGRYSETGEMGGTQTNADTYFAKTNYVITPQAIAPLYYTYLANSQRTEIQELMNEYATATEERQEEIMALLTSGQYALFWDLVDDGIYFGLDGGAGSNSLAKNGVLNFVEMPIKMTFVGGGSVVILVSFTLYFDFDIVYDDSSTYPYNGVAQGPDNNSFKVYRKGFKYTQNDPFEVVASMTGSLIGNASAVSYSPTAHINAGSYSATATYTPAGAYGQKNYRLTVPFVIEKQILSDITMADKVISYGDTLTTAGWASSQSGNTFTYYWGASTSMPTDAGTYLIKAVWNGNNNYTGTIYASLTILPIMPIATISNANVLHPMVLINGTYYNPATTEWISIEYYDSEDYSATNLPLENGKNYIIKIKINQGGVKNNNFVADIINIEYCVPPVPSGDPEEDFWVNTTNTVHIYDGNAKLINAVLMNGSSQAEGDDYYTLTTTYYKNSNPIDTGLNPITETGIYSVVIIVTFDDPYSSVAPITLNTTMLIKKAYLDVDAGPITATYNGNQITKTYLESVVEVRDPDDVLMAIGTDYTISITNAQNNTVLFMQNAGTYIVTVNPIGSFIDNYEPYIFKFTITPMFINLSLNATTINGVTYDGNNKTITVDWSDYEGVFGAIAEKPTLVWSGATFSANSNTEASVKNAGTYNITAVIEDMNFVGTASVQFSIRQKAFTITQKVFETKWLPNTTWATVLTDAFDISGIVSGDTINLNAFYFTLTGLTWGSFIQAGTYSATIISIPSLNYVGSLSFSFRINPSSVQILYDVSPNNNGGTLISLASSYKSHGYTTGAYENADFFEFGRLKYVFNNNTSNPYSFMTLISLLDISTSNNLFSCVRGTPDYSPISIVLDESLNPKISYRVNGAFMFELVIDLNVYASSSNMQFDDGGNRVSYFIMVNT